GPVELDLDAFVAPRRGQHLVERIAGSDDVSGAQRSGAVGTRPDLDHDILGQYLWGRREQRTGERPGNCKLPVHELPPWWFISVSTQYTYWRNVMVRRPPRGARNARRRCDAMPPAYWCRSHRARAPPGRAARPPALRATAWSRHRPVVTARSAPHRAGDAAAGRVPPSTGARRPRGKPRRCEGAPLRPT